MRPLLKLALIEISIHALRGEGDVYELLRRASCSISIHALRGEGDLRYTYIARKLKTFQSTPSVGRATFFQCFVVLLIEISIHALRGEGDVCIKKCTVRVVISIHALRGEGDLSKPTCLCAFGKFQSTPSVGRATVKICCAPIEDGNFNPRPPWGGRPLENQKTI